MASNHDDAINNENGAVIMSAGLLYNKKVIVPIFMDVVSCRIYISGIHPEPFK